MARNTTPDVIPYLYYHDANTALDFLVRAFGFEVKSAIRDDAGNLATAQLHVGDGVVMIGPGMAAFGTRGVDDPKWATCRMHIKVDDVDSHAERSRAAGATVISEPFEHFSGRIYVAADCGGQQWIFSQRASGARKSETERGSRVGRRPASR